MNEQEKVYIIVESDIDDSIIELKTEGVGDICETEIDSLKRTIMRETE